MLLLLLAVCHGVLFGACIAICLLCARAALKVALAPAAAFQRPWVQNYASRPASDTKEGENLEVSLGQLQVFMLYMQVRCS